MSVVHRPMTLGEVIEALRALPGWARVTGMGKEVISYRGYYDHPSVEPVDERVDAHELADMYEQQLGKTMHGYKGGEYPARPFGALYVSPRGEVSDLRVCEFTSLGEGLYEPVFIEEVW